MAFKTFAQLITDVTNRLSMVPGVGAQLYADDRIALMLQHKFNVLFDEVFWHQFMVWETMTLDGTLGVVTTDLTDKIKRFEDIRAIFPDNSNSALPILATTINPFELAGTSPINYDGLNDATKVFQIWPKASTGNLIVHYRVKPDDFVSENEVKFDDEALILGSTYDYLEDDGTNPGATQKFQALFESRLRQLKNLRSQAPISLDPVTQLPSTFTFTELTT